MSGIAAVAILMAIGEGKAPTTAGMVAAVAEAFVPGTAIRISEVPSPSDEAGLDWEQEVDARAVVTIRWEDEARLRVRLRIHVAHTDRWADRVIRFSPDDTPMERGRTLGFAVASMWPDATVVRPSPASTSASSDPAGAVGSVDAIEKAARASPLPRRALSASVRMAEGIRGTAEGFGGSLDGALFLEPAFALRVGVELRAGSVAEVPGKSLVGIAAVGFEWWPLPPSRKGRLALGVRGDLLILRHQIFDSADDATSGRFIPGAYLGPEVAIRIWRAAVELLFGIGIEVALGRTELRRGDPLVPVATIPPLRAIGHGGLRFRF